MIPIPVNEQSIEHAVAILRQGGLVAFPTETVYGLGADANNSEAINKIFAAKGRPADHPLIVHIAITNQLHDWAEKIPESALTLAQAFWPGPLTIILNKKAKVSELLTGGQNTIALRVPGNPVALQLLTAFGGGIAAPSANLFGHISPTLASHVNEDLGDKVNCILDGGACTIGLESTIIDLSSEHPTLLRPGRITLSQLRAQLQTEILVAPRRNVRAPGMLESHYAPNTKTLLYDQHRLLAAFEHNTNKGIRSGILAYSQVIGSLPCANLRQLPSKARDFETSLYRTLRELDNMHLDMILVEKPPETEAWSAVNDRLAKATA